MNHIRSIVLSIIILVGLNHSMVMAKDSSREFDMRNSATPAYNLLTGGQPSLRDLEKLAKQGNKVVVNLRTKGEFDKFDEKAAVEKLGMKYVSIEIGGGEDINLENVKRLDAALNGLNEPALVHCASSNRVGGLLAYRAFKLQNQSASEALAFGKKSGMRSTVKTVKKLIAAESK